MTVHTSSFPYDRQAPSALSTTPTQDLQAHLHQSVVDASALLKGHACSIALLDDEQSSLVTLAASHTYGAPLRGTRFLIGEGIAGSVFQKDEMLLIRDTRHDARFKRLGERPIGSMVCLPLRTAARCIGTITASSPHTDAFDSSQVHILTLFSVQIARTIEALQQLQAARQTQARFLSLMTHELRAPLNTINGYLELLISGVEGELTAEQYAFARRARAGSEHLYALLENLFFISRLDAAQLRLSREIIRLPDVISEAIEELELSASDRNITVSPELNRSLPRLYADPLRLRQAIRNLLDNALCFTPAGGAVQITTSVETPMKESDLEEATSYLHLQIRDSGIGIDPQFHARIFERFFQVPGAQSEHPGGQGLGLPVARSIVELHGGQLLVESTEGQGSRFTCVLPCLPS